jgi:hypothetical protein
MLRSADIEAFLTAHGITAKMVHGQELPDMPDEVVLIELSGGLSSTYERLFDRPAVRVTVRGKQGDPDSAEALAEAVDNAFLTDGPITLGGKHVTTLQRLSGPPNFVGLDARGGGRRSVLQASYVPEVAR